MQVEEGVTPRALQEAMSCSLLDVDMGPVYAESPTTAAAAAARQVLEEQKRAAAQQQLQKKAMLMELRAVSTKPACHINKSHIQL